MSTNNVSELTVDNSDLIEGFVKLYTHGKIALLFDGPQEYQRVAEECLKRALKVRISVDGRN